MWVYTQSMSSDGLMHWGIPGQKHGVRNGPPYPLDYSKLSSEEKAAAKGRAIRDGNIKEANVNKAEFTDQEMTQLKNRFNLNEEVARLAIKDIKTGKQRIKEMTDVLGNVAELANKSLVLYNTAAKVYNGLNEDSSLPIFDGNNKKKKQNKN